jgi:hypothetical protein
LPQEKLSERVLGIISRKRSNGLVTASSQCSPTSSGIGRCTEPHVPLMTGTATWPRHSLSGPSFLSGCQRSAVQKPSRVPQSLRVGLCRPLQRKKVGTEGEVAARLSPSPPVRRPNDCRPKRSGAYGGQGKAVGRRRRLCCLRIGISVLANTSGKIELQSDLRASDIVRPRGMIVPHTRRWT